MHLVGLLRLKLKFKLKDNHVFFMQYSTQWSLINWCQVVHNCMFFEPHDFAVLFYEVTLVAPDAMADE